MCWPHHKAISEAVETFVTSDTSSESDFFHEFEGPLSEDDHNVDQTKKALNTFLRNFGARHLYCSDKFQELSEVTKNKKVQELRRVFNYILESAASTSAKSLEDMFFNRVISKNEAENTLAEIMTKLSSEYFNAGF